MGGKSHVAGEGGLGTALRRQWPVTVPDFIMAKVRQRQPLSEGDTKLWRHGQVPEAGYTLLRHIPRLEPVALIVRYQHKHFDGGGLPEGPAHGELIPLGARMLKVLLDLADIEARHITRPGALALMQRQANRYDPQILAAAHQCMVQADPIPQQIPTISIPFQSLASGHVLAGDIQTVEGKILLSAGCLVTQVLMERLRNHAAIISIKEPICVRANS